LLSVHFNGSSTPFFDRTIVEIFPLAGGYVQHWRSSE
jgi:hypothetical protein